MKEEPTHSRWWLSVVFWSAIFTALALGAAYYRYGSVDNAVNAIGGQVLLVSEFSTPTCTAAPDTTQTIRVPVRNLHHNTVTVVGAKTSCGCLEAMKLPFPIAATASDELHFRYISGDEDWSGVVDVQLFVNIESPPILFVVNVHTTSEKDVQ